ncbi:hypothetical protein EV191_101926 [Tamaricihabitans halophyticus]|uniref:Uncharacterized protein n=1 Tax=Tamaricihabitans halophyticus TaxID=1262583 RepID=A0A4V2SV35_9PSEU|nr:hypothetical protein [Tamaricihabitans halophyticus]TCP56976.1 hypothetical protein EV191_101926 [Tamaricihabitans halophyticus]
MRPRRIRSARACQRSGPRHASHTSRALVTAAAITGVQWVLLASWPQPVMWLVTLGVPSVFAGLFLARRANPHAQHTRTAHHQETPLPHRKEDQ